MANDRHSMTKDEADQTHDAAPETAHEVGRLIGEWLGQVLARVAAETRHARPPSATTRDGMAELLDARLRPIEEALGRLAKRVAALEEQASRHAEPESTEEMDVLPPPVGAEEVSEPIEAGPPRAETARKRRGPPRRELPEPVRTEIDELHQAGRSMYAISKEVGVPYHVVYGYVKSRGGRA